MERSRIGIIIPALNEAATVATVVRAVQPYGQPIVVDDGSSDGTGGLAAQQGAQVVRHESNQGYDAALNSGFAKAAELGCDFVISLDADGQHDPTLLGRFIHELQHGAELVAGVRDRRQRLGEHLFAWVGTTLWGLRDPLCGMKGYRMGLYRELGHFDEYRSIGTELAIYAARKKKRVVQLPVPTRARLDQPRFGRRWSANARILRALALSILTVFARLADRNQPRSEPGI